MMLLKEIQLKYPKPILEKNKHKRVLLKYPNTSNDILCYIGQYGPVVSTIDNVEPNDSLL